MPMWQYDAMIYAILGVFVLSTGFWIATICHKPGYIKPHPKVEFLVSDHFFISLMLNFHLVIDVID